MSSPDDPRTDQVGLGWKPPPREEAARLYLGRSWRKLRVAEWHGREFGRLENDLAPEDLFDWEKEPLLPVQAHADSTVLQLGASLDAFACAVAHWYSFPDAERASFGRTPPSRPWAGRLLDAAEGLLKVAIRETAEEESHTHLMLYRNLAAHRGMLGEQQVGYGPDGEDTNAIRLHLPDWLPPGYPDDPQAQVRPILHRYLLWARPTVVKLTAAATTTFQLSPTESGEDPS